MMDPEFNDREFTEMGELIELFEKYLKSNEQHFFDEDSLERILEYYEMRNLPERAEAVADYAINQNPYSSDFLVRKAEFLVNRKKYNEALDLLDKAYLFDSHEIDIYLLRSDIYIETNQPEKAEEILFEALEMADDDEKDAVYAELSDIYEIQENFDKAFDCLAKALSINPSSEDALYKLSHIVDMTDKYDESVALHLSIIEKEPYAWLAWFNLGRAYMGLGLYEKAIESFEFVMAIDENFDLVYRDAADVYYRIENFEKAISMFELAHEKSGGYEDYSFRIGLCYERLENYKSARFHFRKAARQDPFLSEAYFRIGETYRQEDRFEPALVNYKKALKLDDSNEDYICTLISIYKMLDRDEDVIFYLKTLVKTRPDILSYWLDYIIYLMELAKYEEVIDVIHDAITLSGHYPEYFYLQSAALFNTGKSREAISVLEHALTMDYSRHTILYEVCKEVAMRPEFQKVIGLYNAN